MQYTLELHIGCLLALRNNKLDCYYIITRHYLYRTYGLQIL